MWDHSVTMVPLSLADQLAVAPEALRHRLDPASLPFATTAGVAPLTAPLGQPRAQLAIELALAAHGTGYNLYVAGRPGAGRESTVRDFVTQVAASRPVPPDWVYVHNFAEPHCPNAIRLPAGSGRQLARDMDELLEYAQREIPRAFESEDYERRRHAAIEELTTRRDTLVSDLQAFARSHEFAVDMTPTGIVSIPLLNGQPIPTGTFPQLAPEVREAIGCHGKEVQAQVAATLRQLRQLDKEAAARERQLQHEIVAFVTGPLFEEMKEQHGDQAEVLSFLDRVAQELPEHLDVFASPDKAQAPLPFAELPRSQPEHLSRFRVHVLIDHSQTTGAPVILERNPTLPNLVGHSGYRAVFGAMLTDVQQIEPGALHRASGGFLLLHAQDLLANPLAWPALKRALLTGEVRIESPGEQLMILPRTPLRPEPIPLDLKVILIGSPVLYQLLYVLDEEFAELFAVRADFAPDMPWSEEGVGQYAAFVSGWVQKTGLKAFDRTAVARVVEYGARLRDHQHKLSTRFLDLANLLTEAGYWASQAGHDTVTAEDVDQAIAKKAYRANLVEERVHDLIAEGTLLIDTVGEQVGQVNGVSIVDLGDYAFGQPTRITARVGLGRGTILSIEREIELSGPSHSKGVLTLAGYLTGLYVQEWPLALAATLTFEQSYDEVEGDSASSAELYALLSALAGLPLTQSIAVTGAVNQHGEVEAVGGVTRKIEGFFAVCRAHGLTGEQGVLIPASNLPHLMLTDEVIEAVRAGQFHVWAVHHVNEGIALLTGHPAGEHGTDGQFPEETVHRLVEQRLQRYAELAYAYASSPDGASRRDRGDEQ
jgi:predicted ATP-dependent protease